MPRPVEPMDMGLSRRRMLTTTGLAVAAGAAVQLPAHAEPLHDNDKLSEAADYTVAKLRSVAPHVTAFPVGTKFEKWTYSQNGDWVGGFWPGLLWLAWLHTGDTQFRTLAETAATKLGPRATDTSTHDVGFLFTPSWITAHRLTGAAKWRDGAITAAGSLIKRYNPRGKFIRAWGALDSPTAARRTIMDTIMNLDLLVFATRQTGDPKYQDIATAHARTQQTYFPRPDGSTPHVLDFTPDT